MSTKNTPKLPSPSGRGSGRGRTIAIQAAVAIVLIALVAIIGVSVAHKKKTKDDQASQAAAAAEGPASVFHDDALRFGNTDPHAKVVLRMQEDFQCPACRAFETASGGYISDLIKEGKVAVDYSPIAILDNHSTTNYSSRADNASVCVAAEDKSKWLGWHKIMYDHQPDEGSAGLTEQQLVDIAKQAGLTSPDVAQCIVSGKYAQYVQAVTQRAVKGGLNHTPTVKVNGTEVSDITPAGLKKAIDAAEKK